MERPEAIIHGFAREAGANSITVLTELGKILSSELHYQDTFHSEMEE